MTHAPAPPAPSYPPADAVARRWLARWAVAAAVLAALTFLVRTWPDTLGVGLGPFDLGRESNVAAWFSASSLLWSGLLMGSAAAFLYRKDPPAAAATGVMACVALALCVDEAGSLHERFDLLVPASLGLSLKKFAAILAVPVAVAIGVLFLRRRVLGHAWALILGAYLLFGTVFAQELLEHAIDWPERLLPLRMIIEEGTELVGFFLLLLAAVRLGGRARGVAGKDASAASARELVLPTRGVLLLAFAVAALAAPVMVLWLLSVPFSELQLNARGDFASTMMLAIFFIAGGFCLRRAYAGEARSGGWLAVAGACFVLSLLQNWNLYTDAFVLTLGRAPEQMWRSCFDMAWALPAFIVLTLLVRRQTGMKPWVALAFVFAWLVALAACTRSGFKLSYASDLFGALIVGGWAILATRRAVPGIASNAA